MGLNIPVEARSGSGVTCNKNHSRAARQRDARGGAWMRGVHGGAMRAIYQHRTDNEVPRRLPVVEDDDDDDDRAAVNSGRRTNSVELPGSAFRDPR